MLVQAVRAQRKLVVKAETSTEGQVDVDALVKDLQAKVRPGRRLDGLQQGAMAPAAAQ